MAEPYIVLSAWRPFSTSTICTNFPELPISTLRISCQPMPLGRAFSSAAAVASAADAASSTEAAASSCTEKARFDQTIARAISNPFPVLFMCPPYENSLL